MIRRCSNPCIDIEVQAKKTLAFFSDCEQNNSQWEMELKLNNTEKKRSSMRIHEPIRNLKYSRQFSRQQKKRQDLSQNLSFGGRTLLIPCKVSLENQEGIVKKNPKTNGFRNPYLMVSKQNCKPYKTIRAAHSLARQAQEKQEEQGFDFMQYWIKHRFQDGAVNALVERLKDKKNVTGIRF